MWRCKNSNHYCERPPHGLLIHIIEGHNYFTTAPVSADCVVASGQLRIETSWFLKGFSWKVIERPSLYLALASRTIPHAVRQRRVYFTEIHFYAFFLCEKIQLILILTHPMSMHSTRLQTKWAASRQLCANHH